jgi:hypothetical protein
MGEEARLTIQELCPWDGPAALLIDGGSDRIVRPPVHLQAAAGGYLRLVGPHGTLVWGLVDSGWYGVDIVRAKDSLLQVLPPIRTDEAQRAPGATSSPEFVSWWTRRYAEMLCASSSTPLAQGRCYLLASTESAAAAIPDEIDSLLEQREEFEIAWDIGDVGLLLTRQLSAANDGRVKMWRKHARDRTLPPVVTWWCEGLFAHVLLDGHDRLHAALLEDMKPDVIRLANAVHRAEDEMKERKRATLEQAATLDGIPSPTSRAFAMNRILRDSWDPRTEWKIATPGFPLDGGIEQWEQEVRGTWLAAASAQRREDANRA